MRDWINVIVSDDVLKCMSTRNVPHTKINNNIINWLIFNVWNILNVILSAGLVQSVTKSSYGPVYPNLKLPVGVQNLLAALRTVRLYWLVEAFEWRVAQCRRLIWTEAFEIREVGTHFLTKNFRVGETAWTFLFEIEQIYTKIIYTSGLSIICNKSW